MIKKIKYMFSQLSRSIFVGERLEKNLRINIWIGYVFVVVGCIMTVINYVQHKGFVTYTTAVTAVCGLIIVFSVKVLKKRSPAVWAAMAVCVGIFTYYALFGVNDGFAVLWTILVPIAMSYFAGVKYGLLVSTYYELLFIILFYTPVRRLVEDLYTKTFMDRFPVLYICGTIMTSIAMINYHLSTLAQMNYEERLKEAAETAIAAGNAKSRFLAEMSHEIRTPINAILGMNEMILRECRDNDILEYSSNIQVSGKNLLTIINSILDFAKIEDGKMEIVPVRYDTSSLIHNLLSTVSERAHEKGLKLEAEISGTLPSAMVGDDVRISQVVMNLLTNAVKYTEKGSASLIVRDVARADGCVDLYFGIRDTGIGIREEDMGKLFESFERLEEKRNRSIEGTGLGMPIVVKLLALMGSELDVKSVYGEGSLFSFVLRQQIADDTPLGDYNAAYAKSGRHEAEKTGLYAPAARVLVVDDNSMNLKVAKNLLKLYGIVPDLVASGEEAIERIAEKDYEIVFLDHMMPVMDGIETLEKMKGMGLPRDGTAVVALTANAVAGAREGYLEAGFDDYLSKPMELNRLEDKLRKFIPKELIELREETCEDAGEGKPEEPEPVVMAPGTVAEPETAPAEPETPAESAGSGSEGGAESDSDRLTMNEVLEKGGISVSNGLMYCAGDSGFYAEMLADYASACGVKCGELESFYASKELNEYKVRIHALKSVSRTIGADALADSAKALEDAARTGDAEYIEQHHGEFIAAYRKTVDDIMTALGRS